MNIRWGTAALISNNCAESDAQDTVVICDLCITASSSPNISPNPRITTYIYIYYIYTSIVPFSCALFRY